MRRYVFLCKNDERAHILSVALNFLSDTLERTHGAISMAIVKWALAFF